MNRLLVGLIFMCLPGLLLAGGPWPAGKNKGFLKIGQRALIANRFFNPEGQVIPITTTGIYITSLYGEFGLNDRWTVKAYAPLLFRATLNEVRFLQSGRTFPGDQYTGIGDADLGISYFLYQKNGWALGATLRLGLPVGETSGGETGLLQTGDGEFNQLIQFDAGYSFWPRPFFLSGSVGFNNRTRGFSDEFHFGFDAGMNLGKRGSLIVKTYTLRSFFNGDAPQTITGIFSNNIQFLSFGPELNLHLPKGIGVSAGAFFAAAATNVLATPSLDLGIFYKW